MGNHGHCGAKNHPTAVGGPTRAPRNAHHASYVCPVSARLATDIALREGSKTAMPTDRSALAADIWRACDIMRRDDGTTGSLEYMEQLSWLLFLKVFEAIEDRLAVEAELATPPRSYARIVDGEYRWSVWAHRDFPAEKLVA